jgi:hypothetical protein
MNYFQKVRNSAVEKKNLKYMLDVNNILKGETMLDILLWVAVGAFIGWNFPQPFWAKMMQEKIQAMIAKK